MTAEQPNEVLRLPKKHAAKAGVRPGSDDGGRLVRAQSARDAFVASCIVVILFSVLWTMLSTAIGRIFPWLTLLLGVLIGLTVRRAGRGLDWRFPVLAAAMTLIGALTGNVVVAAAFTAAEFDTGTLTILRAVTSMTWPVFFDEAMTPADGVYALFGAAIAAFYANRRLNRIQYLALKTWERERDGRD